MRFRILTLLMYALVTMLVVRFVDLMDRKIRNEDASFFSSPLYAKEEAKKEEDKDKKSEDKKENKDDKKESDSKKDDKNEKDDKADKSESDSKAPPKEAELPTFTQTEVEILQRLSYRRKELEDWQKELELKEQVLSITQTKIDQKLNELRVLKQDVQKVLDQYNAKDDEKIMSLVKIYEKMKPKAAAQIFAEIDLPILLKVSRKMKEPVLATIMAEMEPKKAKEITESLAKLNSLSTAAMIPEDIEK